MLTKNAIFMVLMATKNPNEELLSVFTREFEPQLGALERFAFSLTNNSEQAADLVQDTMERAIKSLHLYQQGTNARSWLCTIMRNLFINEYRKRSRGPKEVDYEDVALTLAEEPTENLAAMIDWGQDAMEQLLGDEVNAAMQRLSEDFRTVVVLSDLLDFKYEEIAETIAIPVGTVRSRLFRARNLLAKELKEYAEARGLSNQRNNS